METQSRSSRKRKHSSSSSSSSAAVAANSNLFSGILTRHKSQKFFFHHNRSGKSRRTRSFPSSLSNPELPTNHRLLDSNVRDVVSLGDGEDDSICQGSIKDLRAHRVFSKPVGVDSMGKCDGKVGKSVNPNFESKLIAGKLGDCDVKFDENHENPNLLVKGECDSGVELKRDGLNEENPNLLVKRESDSGVELERDGLNEKNPNLVMSKNCDDSGVELTVHENCGNPNLSMLEKCVDSKGECLNGGNPNLSIDEIGAKSYMSPDLKGRNGHCEVDVQTSPPDAVVLYRQSEDQSLLRGRRADSKSPPKKISPSKGGIAEEKRSFPTSKRNLGLTPCSRPKIFKVPNSFSYKRLLPFLMDLGKDTPDAPKVNQSIKIEKDVEVKPPVFFSQDIAIDCPTVDEKPLATVVSCKPQEMNVDGKEEENLPFPLDLKNNDSDPQQAAPCTPINTPIEKTLQNPVMDESPVETPVSDDPKNCEASLDGQVSPDELGKSGDISPIIESDLAITLHSPKRTSEPSGEEAVLDTPPHLPLSNEHDCRTANMESNIEENSIIVLHNSAIQGASVCAGAPSFGQANGILKRNPRGCRGICNCLNCASFRLNAEKAFEFSRNQWLDAEELAMDLMKELSNLRSVLEESVNGSNVDANVPIDQVQEICRRASDAEDIARRRLNQMSEDLHVHCRTMPLQRPAVNFSSSVQEKKDHKSLGSTHFTKTRKPSMRILD